MKIITIEGNTYKTDTELTPLPNGNYITVNAHPKFQSYPPLYNSDVICIYYLMKKFS